MPAAPRHLLALTLLLVLLHPQIGWAQGRVERSPWPVFPCRLPVTVAVARAAPVPRPFPGALLRGGGQPAAQFEVTYDGFSPEAEAAFQAAVDVWAQSVTSAVPIRIEAHWVALGPNVLGSAGPFLLRGFAEAPVPGTWYPAPLADALAGRDLDPGSPDITANFNADFGRWHFATDGLPAPDEADLFTVVLHELGHGLGFIGSAQVEGGLGAFGLDEAPGVPFLYDRFASDRLGTPLLDEQVYPDPSAALADVLQEAVFFEGRAVRAAHGTSAPLFTPPAWDPGSSYSHYDEGTFPPGSPGALMTPRIVQGEAIATPDALACAALEDLGWVLAPACATLVPDAPPLPDVFTLAPDPCTPGVSCDADTIITPDRAAFELVVEHPQRVDVRLFDTRGRRIAVLLDRSLEAGAATRIEVPTGGLAAGLYLVRFEGESFATTRKVIRIR